MELFASILLDIGILMVIVGSCIAKMIHIKEVQLIDEDDIPFWESIFVHLVTNVYWNEFPDFKHRLLVIMSYVLPISGLILVAIGGCLGGVPLLLLHSV